MKFEVGGPGLCRRRPLMRSSRDRWKRVSISDGVDGMVVVVCIGVCIGCVCF